MNIQARLDTLSKVAEEKLKAINIPIKSVARYTVSNTKAWGDCRRTLRYGTETYSIRITKALLEQGSDDKVVQVLIHELLHTACFNDGHKGMFKVYGDRVMRNYPQYKVSRCDDEEGLGVDRASTANYVVACSCGKQFNYQKKANIIQDLERKENGLPMIRSYRCPMCSRKNEFTIIKR